MYHLVVQVEHSVQYVSVSIQQLLSEMTSEIFGLLVHLGTVYGIFEGQGHGSEFTVTGRNLFLRLWLHLSD